MSDQHKYARKIVGEVEESLSIISEKIEPNSVVLDIGCSSGMLGRHLVASKGCIIDGIDIDHEAIEKCSPLYRKVVIKNLDKDEFVSSFVEQSYDFIVVADVVEHLYDTANLVSQLRLLLKPTGTVIFSVPNIAHIASALELLYGNFNYRESGLLDSTHIRFFSFDGLVRKLEASGLYAHEFDSVQKQPHDTEYGAAHTGKFPPKWIDALVASRPDALVYQWIVSTKLYPLMNVAHASKLASRKTPLFTTALYWADAVHRDFSEDRKNVAVAWQDEHKDTVASFSLDTGDDGHDGHDRRITKLRLDPVSEPKIVWIKQVTIEDEQRRPIWSWNGIARDAELSGASWLESNIVQGALFYGFDADPHWHLPLDGETLGKMHAGCSLTVVFTDDRARIDPYLAHCAKSLVQTSRALHEKQFEINAMSETNAHLQQRIDEYVHANNALTHSVAVLKESDEEKRQILARLHGSASWRITAPLRSLMRLFK